MSDLEPIKKNQFKKHQHILDTQTIMLDIRNSILKLTGIEVNIKKIQPPTLIIITTSASAASELHLYKTKILVKLQQYNITQLIITIQ